VSFWPVPLRAANSKTPAGNQSGITFRFPSRPRAPALASTTRIAFVLDDRHSAVSAMAKLQPDMPMPLQISFANAFAQFGSLRGRPERLANFSARADHIVTDM